MVISTLCLSSILSNILTFNFTYICMAGEKPENFSNMTGENSKKFQYFINFLDPSEWLELGYNPQLDYSSAERSALFMAVAIGSLLAVFPLTILLNNLGSRSVTVKQKKLLNFYYWIFFYRNSNDFRIFVI